MKNLIAILLVFTSMYSFSQSTWTEMKSTELPDTVNSYIKLNYNKYELIKAAKKKNNKGDLIYRIDIQKKRKLYHLVFNDKGILIDKSKSKVFEYDGSEKKRKPSSGGGMEPPRMPSM